MLCPLTRRFLVARSMARASSAHVYTWLILGLLAFLQAPGRTAADTKFDLLVNPAGFLAAAGHAYTDTFTLGQIQNQAYGYLFPHGLFFLLTDPLPDWVAQRLWWTVVMGAGFSGTYLVARKLGFTPWPAWAAGLLYALSPRVLTTLTAISSEAWPVALVPWTLLPLLGATRLTWRDVAAAVVPIALMGAVNATATMMACLSAFVLLLWRGAWKHLGGWLVGAAAVSAWWIGPLLVLGKYSAPFTDFIESSYVTTRWLNLAEIFRGTTSWAPFVDTERTAGHLLVAEPVFVLATMAVAAVGIVGLVAWHSPWRGYFVVLLCLGVALMGAAHGPFEQAWLSFLDGPGAPFRNLHKLDPLVRLPLVIGVAAVLARVKLPQAVAVGLAAIIAVAPAWSLRLAPTGTWKEVSPDWLAAAKYLDNNMAGTRTLVVPEASFARQTWGWTRDEPIQALTHVPFAVRDAVPLVDPEAIRGLDGQVTALSPEALRAIGVGAVVVRKDLDPEQAPTEPTDAFGEPTVSFGDIDIHVLDPSRGMMIAPTSTLTTVNGGGEVLPLLDREFGYQPRLLTDHNEADIITDTPALVKRNYGTLRGPVSAHLPPDPASPRESGNVRNKQVDYPSAGQRVGVRETGGTVSASSSAADAGSFGGAIPAQSLTAAVDGLEDTFWHPAPGDADPWLEVAAPGPITITATEDTQLTVTSLDGEEELSLTANEPVTVTGPATLFPHDPVGLSLDAPVHRIVEVPGTGDTYFFQRLLPETDVLQRAFTTATDSQWELSAHSLIDGTPHPPGPLTLPSGRHELASDAETVTLTRAPVPADTWAPFTGTVNASDEEQIILTTRAFNEGLRGTIGDTPLEPVKVDSGMQGFIVPAGVAGEFTMSFAGSSFYRASLLGGGALSALTLVFCIFISRRHPQATEAAPVEAPYLTAATLVAAGVCAGVLGLVAWAAGMAIKRFTLIPTRLLGGGAAVVMGLWLARAPWPAGNYAGDSLAIALAGCVVLASLAGSSGKRAFPPARS